MDYAQYRVEVCSKGEVWDDFDSLSSNLTRLFQNAVILPHANIQLSIITAYTLIPSALASVVPILYLHGNRGSGKSRLATIIAAMHDFDTRNAGASFASLRDAFNRRRWLDPYNLEGERNVCLVLDNLNKDTLINEQLYTMLLCGYSRKTDLMTISLGRGETASFRVFGSKVVSSVHPLFAQQRFSELERRCLIVTCKPFEAMKPEELSSNTSVLDTLDIESLNLSFLNLEYVGFWDNPANLTRYSEVKLRLSQKPRPCKIPKIISGSRWTIGLDLLTTGIVTGVWHNYQDAVDTYADYWRLYDKQKKSTGSVLIRFLEGFINDELETIKRIKAEVPFAKCPEEINPEKLKKAVTIAHSQGMLDIYPSPGNVADAMYSLGWELGNGTQGKITWRRLGN